MQQIDIGKNNFLVQVSSLITIYMITLTVKCNNIVFKKL